jgi:hypothetical protein
MLCSLLHRAALQGGFFSGALQTLELVFNPRRRCIDPVQSGATSDARELIATDPRSPSVSAERLLRQQQEPPRRRWA